MDLGGTDRLFDRPIGRDFQLDAAPSTSGGIEGTFTERWFGVFPAAVEVSGRITLTRVSGTPPADFTVDLPASLPPNPSATPPTIDAACFAATAPLVEAMTPIGETAESGTACTAISTPAQLAVCGTRLLLRASRVRRVTLVTAGFGGYDDMATVCGTRDPRSDRRIVR